MTETDDAERVERSPHDFDVTRYWLTVAPNVVLPLLLTRTRSALRAVCARLTRGHSALTGAFGRCHGPATGWSRQDSGGELHW